jgi:hypothetical protein
MRAAKVNVMAELAAHRCIIHALMSDRQSQISYRCVNAPIAGRSFQFGLHLPLGIRSARTAASGQVMAPAACRDRRSRPR